MPYSPLTFPPSPASTAPSILLLTDRLYRKKCTYPFQELALSLLLLT